MNYLIIEDELHNTQLLDKYVQQIKTDGQLLAIIPSVAEAIEWFEEHTMPDIIFMDIRLEDGLSFEIFSEIAISCPIIFTTAYDEYALQAFKVYGTAYLLKPIIKEELAEVIDKFYVKKQHQDQSNLTQLLSSFLSETKTFKKQFLIHYKDQLLTIPVQDIDYVFVELKTTFFSLTNGETYAVPFTLEEIEQQLDTAIFFRANRQYIIGMNSIHSIHKYFNEKAKVILKNNKEAEILISRIRLPYFKQWLDQ